MTTETRATREYVRVRETTMLYLVGHSHEPAREQVQLAEMVRELPDGEWRLSAADPVRTGPAFNYTAHGLRVTLNAGTHEDDATEFTAELYPWSQVKSILTVRERLVDDAA